MEILLLVVLGFGLPTMLARAGHRMRPVVIALAAVCSAYIGLVDPLWGHLPVGIIVVFTFFLVLATIGAAVARDRSRVKGGMVLLAITWTSYLLVSAVASAGHQ